MNRQFLLELLPKNSIGAEVGVWKGDFSHQIYKSVNPKILYLIDPWLYQPQYNQSFYGKKNMNQRQMDNIYQSVVDKFKNDQNIIIIRELSKIAAKHIANESLDWIYIDGDHTFVGAKNDINIYAPKIKIGGYLCGDDYTTGGWWKGGVKKAVDEFLIENNNFKLIKIENQQYVLKKSC